MALLLTAPQCFFIVILAFAVVGFQRGWRREVLSLVFVLGGVLFLYLNGGRGVAQFLFTRLPVIFQDASGSANVPVSPTSPSDSQVLITTFLVFVVIVVLGYIVGNRAFPPPSNPSDRIMGAIPSIVSGYAIISYITNAFSRTPLITIGVNTPSQSLLSSYMLVIFVIAVILAIVGLVVANTRKSAPPKK